MSWTLIVMGPARKSLERLPLDIRARILKALQQAALSEITQGDVKRMQGEPVRYRLRVGDYRIIFELVADQLVVKRVAHRREVYRD